MPLRHLVTLASTALFMLAVVALGPGCHDYGLETANAAIIVEPEELNFGYVTTGTEVTKEFQIKNVGQKAVEIEEFTFEADVDYFSLDRDLTFSFELATNETETVTVVFAPHADLEPNTNIVYVHHEADEDEPEPVLLTFEAGNAPDIHADPNPVNFGGVNSDEVRTEQVLISNTSSGIINVGEITYQGDPEFSVDTQDAVGANLKGDDVAAIEIIFSPDGAEGAFSGEVLVASNDPDENPLVIPVSGGAGVPYAYCTAAPNPVLAIYESSTFYADDGAGNFSGDPSYGPADLTFFWSLIAAPNGSTVTMPPGNSMNRTITPDVAGTYRGQLIVCNPLEDCSAPCVAEFEATIEDDLWVEMFWQLPGDDMDLHLLAPGGQFNNNNTDCYYSNCTPLAFNKPDWGVQNDPTDDPGLDVDDIPGTGPENINILDPAAGIYTILVHDYPGSVNNSPNSVTINIYTFGALEWTDTRSITTEDSANPFAECSFPAGTCTSL